jgi:Tannase-like family of unknown function (DUF6351)
VVDYEEHELFRPDQPSALAFCMQLHCMLKPIDAKDYKQQLSAEQLAQLARIFPEGVCDYAKAGVGQEPLAGTWAVFKGDGELMMLEPRR